MGREYAAIPPALKKDAGKVRSFRNIIGYILAVAALSLASPQTVAAQQTVDPQQTGAPQSSPDSIAAIALQIDGAKSKLTAIRTAARLPGIDDAGLKAQIDLVPIIDNALDLAVSKLAPREAALDARLAELGVAPAAGQPPEAAEITQERAQLQKSRSAIDTELRQAKLLIVEADQLSDNLDKLRQHRFSEHLWAQNSSILDPGLWKNAAHGLVTDLQTVSRVLAGQPGSNSPKGGIGALTVWLIMLFGLVLAFVVVRPVIDRLAFRQATRLATMSRLRQSSLALWTVIIAGLLPCLVLWQARSILLATGALPPTLDSFYLLAARATVFSACVEGLGRALLSPHRSTWRLMPLSDEMARRLRFYPAALAVTIGLSILFAGLRGLITLAPSTALVGGAITSLLEIIVIGSALVTVSRDEDPKSQPDAPTRATGARLPWVIAGATAWVALLASGFAIVLGFFPLASFTMREMIWIALVLAMLFLLVRVSDDLIPALLLPDARTGRMLRRGFGASDRAFAQISVLLCGAVRVLLYLVAWTQILLPFGAGATDMLGRINSADFVLHLGAVTISPGLVLGAALIFGLGLVMTRSFRKWLERSYLPTTSMDIGVRTSLATAMTYTGALIAVVVTSAYLGLSLDRIALLASALSIGIGFGLQSIISNFVSGLILLAERPVRVGDWIAIGDLEGDIKRINVRATEIEMRDRSRLIVPNSDLITKTVRNVTHGASIGRMQIVLRVDDSADPHGVRDLLAAQLVRHVETLGDPAPSVYLTDASNGALEFTCFAYVASARDSYRVRSDILFEIIADLKAQKIALSNSTPVVNIGLGDRPIEPSATPAETTTSS
jgi:potassium efflux system protein